MYIQNKCIYPTFVAYMINFYNSILAKYKKAKQINDSMRNFMTFHKWQMKDFERKYNRE